MTVSSTTARASYAGDGSTTVFAVPFYFLDAGDLTVILRDAAGVETVWTLGTHYTVSGAGSPAGGSITVNTAPTDYTPASSTTLVILRAVPLTQATDYTEGDPLPSATLERDLDKARMIDQQLAETLGRALKFSDGSPSAGITMPEPAADRVLKWTAAADALENWSTVTEIAAVAAVADDIDTVGPIAADITAVAGIGADVSAVAADAADIGTVAGAAAPIATVAAAIADVSAVAADATDIGTVAANLADVTNFADVYIGAATGDPATRADGGALQAGDLYFNTVSDEMRVYDGAAWLAAYVSGGGFVATSRQVASGTGLIGGGDLSADRTLAVDVGSTANKVVQLDGSARLPAVDGSQLTGIGGADDTARAMAVLGLMQADLAGGLNALVVAYDWSSDTLATSTNATHQPSSQSYEAQTTKITPVTAIGDMTGLSGLAAIFDGDTTKVYASNQPGGKSSSPGYAGQNWGTTKSVVKVVAYGSTDQGFAINFSGTVTLTLQGSSDNFSSDVNDLGSTSFTDPNDNTPITFTATNTTAYQYHRVKLESAGTPWHLFAELEFHEVAGNLTLVPAAVPLDTASPSDVSLWVEVDVIDGAAASDVRARISIDGGTTYTTAAVADSVRSMPGGTNRSLLEFRADVSAQSGSSFVWEITTLNTPKVIAFEPIAVPLY